ncbi:hypothetical protein CONPUDRAFT_45980, partial [Coniophora puteana RWD-64-598 SS2]
AHVRDLEKVKSYDENPRSSNSSLADLKRELIRSKDAQARSMSCTTGLKAKLASSDESVVSLQQKVKQLGSRCKQRRNEAEAFEESLARLVEGGVAWRSGLEEQM